jgi:putative spermidine/putrescine transport system permease protein
MSNPKINGWSFLLIPALIWSIFAFFMPLALLIIKSFYIHKGLGQMIPAFTVANYWKFLKDPFYLTVMARTIGLGLIVVAGTMILGYPLAYFLARIKSRWKTLLQFLVIAPLLISVVIRALGWMVLLGENGLINWLLIYFGIIKSPLTLINNFIGVVIGLIHAMLPYMVLSLLNVIQNVDFSLEEASMNLGANRIRTFFEVVFPLSRPGLLAGFLMVLTITISAFTTPAMLGGRKVNVMPIMIEQQMRFVLNYPFGAAISIILLIVCAFLTYLSMNRSGKNNKW